MKLHESVLPGAMLSPGEVKFIKGGVLDDIRADGRARLDFRPLSIETGLLPQTNGSARYFISQLS